MVVLVVAEEQALIAEFDVVTPSPYDAAGVGGKDPRVTTGGYLLNRRL